jgi:hypothetical protein
MGIAPAQEVLVYKIIDNVDHEIYDNGIIQAQSSNVRIFIIDNL